MEKTEEITSRMDKLIQKQIEMKRLMVQIHNDADPIDPLGIEEDNYHDHVINFFTNQRDLWDQLIIETDEIKKLLVNI